MRLPSPPPPRRRNEQKHRKGRTLEGEGRADRSSPYRSQTDFRLYLFFPLFHFPCLTSTQLCTLRRIEHAFLTMSRTLKSLSLFLLLPLLATQPAPAPTSPYSAVVAFADALVPNVLFVSAAAVGVLVDEGRVGLGKRHEGAHNEMMDEGEGNDEQDNEQAGVMTFPTEDDDHHENTHSHSDSNSHSHADSEPASDHSHSTGNSTHSSNASSAAPPSHAHHSSHFVPSEYLDEKKILLAHGPPPLSYFYYDWVLTPQERLDFVRTGLSPSGNATTEMSTLQPDEIIAWQQEQYDSYGGASKEQGHVRGGDGKGHKYLLLLHILLMSTAFFGALPLVIALKAANYKGIFTVIGKTTYWATLATGWVTGWMYKELTPDLYIGQKHGFSGNLLVISAIAISSLDFISFYHRVSAFLSLQNRSLRSFKQIVIYGFDVDDKLESQSRPRSSLQDYQRIALGDNAMELDDIPDAHEGGETFVNSPSHHHTIRHPRNSQIVMTSPWGIRTCTTADADSNTTKTPLPAIRTDTSFSPASSSQSSPTGNSHVRVEGRESSASETSTLRDSPITSDDAIHHHRLKTTGSNDVHDDSRHAFSSSLRHSFHRSPPVTGLRKLAKYLMHFAQRSLVLWAFVEFAWGAVIYIGFSRKYYLPSLLAHFIKGSIFFWYGIITFGRFLGAWAEYGWAWNRRPEQNSKSLVPSAEMVECFLIWLYGVTNTFMERFGAAPGSPYTVKQVQHISIAVMFAGAGMIGMGIESKTVRRLLSSTVFTKTRTGEEQIREPRSYSASFNPFPPLVIGVLGIAMSAHAQDYVFQVTVHALWGYLLAAGSIFRLLTYFFLFISPTTDSILPARPPTEAMTAIMLACGGVVFVLSDEEVTYAAMRHGWDDIMAFLNVVSLTFPFLSSCPFCYLYFYIPFSRHLQVCSY